MGKGSRIKAQRDGSAYGRFVAIDSLEIGHHPGVLTIRGGRDDRKPVMLVFPAEMLPHLLPALERSAHDAEEETWEVLSVILDKVESQDGDVRARAVEHWLRTVPDWNAVVRAAQNRHSDGSLALLTHAGHVAFPAKPPFASERALVVFDPHQIQRVWPGIEQAAGEAQRTADDAVPWPQACAWAMRWMESQPWPRTGYTPPTLEEAEAWWHQQRTTFLSRTPYMRAPEETLDVPSVGAGG